MARDNKFFNDLDDKAKKSKNEANRAIDDLSKNKFIKPVGNIDFNKPNINDFEVKHNLDEVHSPKNVNTTPVSNGYNPNFSSSNSGDHKNSSVSAPKTLPSNNGLDNNPDFSKNNSLDARRDNYDEGLKNFDQAIQNQLPNDGDKRNDLKLEDNNKRNDSGIENDKRMADQATGDAMAMSPDSTNPGNALDRPNDLGGNNNGLDNQNGAPNANNVGENNPQTNNINQNNNGVNPNQAGVNQQQQKGNPGLQKNNDLDKKNPEAKGGPDQKMPSDNRNPNTGNGYGAINKNGNNKGPNNKNSNVGNSGDSSSLARRNMNHNQSAGKQNINANKNKLKGSSLAGGGGLGLGARLGNGLKNAAKGLLDRDSKDSVSGTNQDTRDGGRNRFTKLMKDFLMSFIMRHPLIALGALVVLIIILSLAGSGDFSGSGSSGNCSSSSSSGNVNISGSSVSLDDLKVELINCHGKESDYTVLETVDFDKYVLGVALAEAGPDAPDEALKAQIVAARGFSLTRNKGMCPSYPNDCFYGYNASTKKIRMRACEADQVYWDYEKNIYRKDEGSISLYSPEVTSGTLWKSALSEQRKNEVLSLANSVAGKVLVDSSDNPVSTNYVSTVTDKFISLANQNKTYEEILSEVYSDSKGFNSSSGSGGSNSCRNVGNINYGNYVLDSSGDNILHEPLDSFLNSKGSSLDEFNNLISKNVDKNGYGTRAGVVAAAVTLIAELGNNYDVKVPYFWGGGHNSSTPHTLASGTWGSSSCHTYANNQSYDYCGLDCSGFVPWAIYNGGYKVSVTTASNYYTSLPGAKRVSLTNSAVLQAGDIMESSGHVLLIVGVDESSGQYITAEAAGNQEGVLFMKRSFGSSGYWGVDLTGYYENSNNVRSKN